MMVSPRLNAFAVMLLTCGICASGERVMVDLREVHLLSALKFTCSDWELAVDHSRHGRTEDAIASYNAVLRQDPGNAAAYNNIGAMLSSRGEKVIFQSVLISRR